MNVLTSTHHWRLRIIHLPDPPGLRLEGALDYTTRFALADALATIPHDRDLYLDLEGLEFADAGGLRVLITVADQLTEGHIVRVRSAQARVRRLIELVGWKGAPRLLLESSAPELTPAPTGRLRRLFALRQPPSPA